MQNSRLCELPWARNASDLFSIVKARVQSRLSTRIAPGARARQVGDVVESFGSTHPAIYAISTTSSRA
jgi:hypothetical protein